MREEDAMDRKWDVKMVAARLEEAAETMQRLPLTGLQPAAYSTSWPPILQEFYEAYGWNDVKVRLGPPTPDAIDRMDEVMEWLGWLEPDDVRLLWLRAERVRWKLIQQRFGKARSTLAAHWKAALYQIVGILNRERFCPDNFPPDTKHQI
uniref:DUF6362 domain-containing protein n=1 Tax=Magnetococcus massalia (strain MO-1) TaxID=451514 RepID=A0A1S7LHX5_MAGMO|nr:conserved protein of unknown function [Candidatus Magnetococcus massalia]